MRTFLWNDLCANKKVLDKTEERGNNIVVKVIKLARLAIIGVVITVKVCLLVKVLHAFIKFKYMTIAFGYLLLNAARLWIDAKHHKHDDVYYKAHSHQYDLDDHLLHDEWRREDGDFDFLKDSSYKRKK
ncbi:unnamed protein product [Phyllotreta striolata]|uniref:Uncharacterized protein n=1 Tax=Phyllotreta striolata TaxID=444603 RepID=A0A9N9TVU3_PHYSR|nr:unnamed protein product [Phyllotreta striolata]